MNEKNLRYAYENLLPKSDWLILTHSPESASLPSAIMELGEFFYDGNHYTWRESLDSLHIVFPCLSTSGTVHYRGKTYPFPEAGVPIFLDCRDGYRVETKGEAHQLFVHFQNPGMLSYYNLFYQRNQQSPIARTTMPEVGELLRTLLRLYKRPYDHTTDVYAESVLMELIAAFLKTTAPQRRYSPYVQDAVSFLHQNYRQTLSLEQIAEAVHISKFYLHRTFKQETGLTPVEYLQRLRLQKAKELLQNTNLSQEQICEATGLYNSSYLCKLFRKYENQTPDTYRKTWQV